MTNRTSKPLGYLRMARLTSNLLAAMCLVAACGKTASVAPVADRIKTAPTQTQASVKQAKTQTSKLQPTELPSRPLRAPIRIPRNVSSHVVRPGETLYAIAFLYGVPYKRLAQINAIAAPYTIYVGQRIQLRAPSNKGLAINKAKQKEITGIAEHRSKSTLDKPKVVPDTAATNSEAAGNAKRNISWQWPVSGPLVRRFSTKDLGSKGIEIGGHYNQPVLAAADGKVVYSGSGLLGYGNLIIVAHSERYLSAYAYNSRLLVKEGQSVQAGHRIGAMGYNNNHQAALHFEIRKNGDPVDPLRYLPRR